MDSTQPPPLPPSEEDIERYLNAPILVGGKPFPGTEGMTLTDIELDVLKGGRFLAFAWNISVVVLSFRQSTSLRYVPAGRMSGHHALGWSLCSLLFGWWGFPWGLIYTPACLWHNARGGYDHTRETLGLLLGADHAEAIMQQARPRKPDAMLRALHLLLLALGGLLIYGISLLFT